MKDETVKGVNKRASNLKVEQCRANERIEDVYTFDPDRQPFPEKKIKISITSIHTRLLHTNARTAV